MKSPTELLGNNGWICLYGDMHKRKIGDVKIVLDRYDGCLTYNIYTDKYVVYWNIDCSELQIYDRSLILALSNIPADLQQFCDCSDDGIDYTNDKRINAFFEKFLRLKAFA